MKVKKVVWGSLIEIIPTIIIALIEFVKMKCFVDYIGSSMNGYYQFINQLLGYLFLLEAGLSGAVIYKMYQPMAEQNWDKINAIYSGALIIFRKISKVMLLILIGMLAFFPFFVKGDAGELFIVIVSFILIALANMLSFFMYSRALQPIFYAAQQKYVAATVTNIIKMITSLISIYLIVKFKSLIVIALTIFISKLLEEIILLIIAKRKYQKLKKSKEADTSPLNMTKDLIWHQIGTVSANNVDSVVLMITKGPVMVSIYGAYNYIFRFLTDTVNKITSTISHAFGILFVEESEEKMYHRYQDYLYFCFLIAIFVSLCFLIGARPFVRMWMGQNEYILSFGTIFFFASTLFINIIYSPLITIINVKGMFKESKYFSLISSLVNFILSIIFGYFWGILGVLLATTISSFVSIYLRTKLISKSVFPKVSNQKMLTTYLKNYTIFVVLAFLFSFIENIVMNQTTNYVIWFLYLGIIGALLMGTLGLIGYYTNDYLKELMLRFVPKRRK